MSYINQIWIHPMITPQLCIASIMYVTLFCIVFIFSLFHSHFLWMNYQLAPKLFYLFCTNFFCHVCKTPSVCFFSVLFCFLYYFFLLTIEQLIRICHLLVICIFFNYLSLSDWYLLTPPNFSPDCGNFCKHLIMTNFTYDNG